MSYIKPTFRHPGLPKNKIGFSLADYEGGISTLCAGCGHDSILAALMQACFEINIEPHRIAKMSGIGCSSKTPAYFLRNSHGFNSVHGRMPSVTTGANLANRDLIYLGISGDGDSASIGLGQFCHVIRRNLNMVYIVMNNGCYGLTKGQDSATADYGSVNKSGSTNMYKPIDLASLALNLGANFVGRSFSGDKKQLVPMIKAAMSHPGFALIDIVSPCVTFNNNDGSTKSYSFVRDHIEATSILDFVPHKEEITVMYEEGTTANVAMHDGSIVHFSKLHRKWDPKNRGSAEAVLHRSREQGKVLTGIYYVNPESMDLHALLNTVDQPLNSLKQNELCPGHDILEDINESFR